MTVLVGKDTKAGRPAARIVLEYLSYSIDRYIETYRNPRHLNAPLFWIGRIGEPLGYSQVERSVIKAAKSELRVDHGPHLFRDCAASTACRQAEDSPGLATALLQHTDIWINERHYRDL